jgi:hypothetical protein
MVETLVGFNIKVAIKEPIRLLFNLWLDQTSVHRGESTKFKL